MKKTNVWITLGILAALTPASTRSVAHADTVQSYLHRDVAEAFYINFTTYGGANHTWAESIGPNYDMLQTWNGGDSGVCVAGGQGGCASHRPGYNAQWSVVENNLSFNQINQCYLNSKPGTYAYNGVCHQATNRALGPTNLFFVNYYPIGQSDTSYNIFHYYGTSWPWGNWYGGVCPGSA